MYGAYVEVAAYNRSWEPGSARRMSLHNDCLSWMPTDYFEVPVDASASWSNREYYWEDFILVCEVSELEGPKPLFTIPQDVDTTYDINTLAEKMMSVDYHSGASGPFNETKDTQIVLSSVINGIHAFVDYFLLYDICARGFVRPMCIAYLTSEKKKIVDYFEPLRMRLLEVTRYLKFGNRRLFLQEVELYLDDLLAAKDSYVKKRSDDDVIIGAEGVCDAIDDNITIDLFASNITEAQQMLSADKPILDDASATALFWKLENKLKTQFRHNLYPYVQQFILVSPMHSPKLSQRKNMPNLEMRSVFELCSWGIVVGLNLLVLLQKFYKRDAVTIYMEAEDLSLLESFADPMMIGTHLLADVAESGSATKYSFTKSDEESLNIERNLSELRSFFVSVALKKESQYSVTSLCSSEENLFFDDVLEEPNLSCSSTNGQLASKRSSVDTELSTSPLASSASISSGIACGSEKDGFWSAVESLPESCDEVPEKYFHDYGIEPLSTQKVALNYRLQRSHSRCAVAAILCQSVANHVDYLTPDKAGYGIASIFSQSQHFVNTLYSLLIGQPVLILGSSCEEDLVRSVVQAFDLFIPEKARTGSVVPWCPIGLKVKELSGISLAGLLLPSHMSENQLIPSTMRQKVSVINISRGTYSGPMYSGTILNCLLKVRKFGWDDSALIMFLHSLLLVFAARVALYHHFLRISSGSDMSLLEASMLPQKSKDVLLSALSLNKDDANIVQHLAELLIIKIQDT